MTSREVRGAAPICNGTRFSMLGFSCFFTCYQIFRPCTRKNGGTQLYTKINSFGEIGSVRGYENTTLGVYTALPKRRTKRRKPPKPLPKRSWPPGRLQAGDPQRSTPGIPRGMQQFKARSGAILLVARVSAQTAGSQRSGRQMAPPCS